MATIYMKIALLDEGYDSMDESERNNAWSDAWNHVTHPDLPSLGEPWFGYEDGTGDTPDPWCGAHVEVGDDDLPAAMLHYSNQSPLVFDVS